ncbi:MAG: GNAT family N-acetyltransferase, partial [Aureispira sp.]|nr:GNAT family N-acetyltransferase [Aureispira sp.]
LGIGKQLTLACLDRAKNANVNCVGLHTSTIMEVALPMYLKLGFSKVKDIPDIGGAPYSIFCLEL